MWRRRRKQGEETRLRNAELAESLTADLLTRYRTRFESAHAAGRRKEEAQALVGMASIFAQMGQVADAQYALAQAARLCEKVGLSGPGRIIESAASASRREIVMLLTNWPQWQWD